MSQKVHEINSIVKILIRLDTCRNLYYTLLDRLILQPCFGCIEQNPYFVSICVFEINNYSDYGVIYAETM